MEDSKIPKKIFYVWGAEELKSRDVQMCIYSWQKICPDYEIIEINENSKEYFNFEKELKENQWFKTVYKNKLFAYIADYIRIKVLYEHGGIYLDTDVTTLKNFDEFLNAPAFLGIQQDSNSGTDNLEPAILGAQKGNKILKDILEFYKKDIWKSSIYSMPQIFRLILTDNYGEIYYPTKDEQITIKLSDIYLYPEKYFIPYRFGENFSKECIKSETVTIHWWNASWHKRNIQYFLSNKHKVNPGKLIKKCFELSTKYENKFIKISTSYETININLNTYFLFRFKHKYTKSKKYLVLYVFGFEIPLWRYNNEK